MAGTRVSRGSALALIGTAWVLGLLAVGLIGWLRPPPPEPTLEVVHWTNGHLLRDGSGLRLMRAMASEFNDQEHRTATGERIVVRVFYYGSAEQAADLQSRAMRGVPIDRERPNPTIVTPSAAHWLLPVNEAAGREVVDLDGSASIVQALIGIVTYREMAECLGWPERALGYADIIALRNEPLGWAAYPCARAEWGQRPLVAYTDPTTSSTGRSVLMSLYAIAAGKAPEDLTREDIERPEVVAYVRQFQGLVDHYMIGTIPLNTKIYQGPRYGHFFLMPEDNLIHLYEGTEEAYFGGVSTTAPPLPEDRQMVMLYPKEGTMARNNCACLVQADWVTEEHRRAAGLWIDYLRAEEQQRDFMLAGFRPGSGTGVAVGEPISGRYGLDPAPGVPVYAPERIDPAVAATIERNWVAVKRPGIVTFVADTSGSMLGPKLRQAKDGLIAALDTMASNNQVGFLSFDNQVDVAIEVRPLAENRFAIAEAVHDLSAGGETALYDAIRRGIEMSDAAQGDADAIRAVVVLTDGMANRGATRLDDLIKLMSRGEVPVRFDGINARAQAPNGSSLDPADLIGTALALETRHPVQVFFIGIGDDADLEVGRLLAEATGAEFQGTPEEDLSNVLSEFSKYF